MRDSTDFELYRCRAAASHLDEIPCKRKPDLISLESWAGRGVLKMEDEMRLKSMR